MKQLSFEFENDETYHPNLPMTLEREQQLVELMAQAIAALFQHPQGEEDEAS